MYIEACDEADVFRGEIAHEHPADGPVDDIDARHVAAADGEVVSLVVTGGIEPWQVVGVMAEIGIHLEDIFVVVLQRPLETRDIGGAQS